MNFPHISVEQYFLFLTCYMHDNQYFNIIIVLFNLITSVNRAIHNYAKLDCTQILKV